MQRDCLTRRPGFTLVELLVTLVIIAILASLTLAGLGTVRQRGKEDATRATIRKLHEIIMPMYESYLDRRISMTAIDSITDVGPDQARKKLIALRKTLAFEFPDNWPDVGGVPGPFVNGRTNAYAAYEGSASSDFADAECLYMIVTRSGFMPEAMEQFRAEEIGDFDGDGALEFHDAWGLPIRFVRWPTGFSGPTSLNRDVDPFDPSRKDTSFSTPGVIPLIASAGADQEYGLYEPLPIGSQSNTAIGSLDTVTAVGVSHFGDSLAGGASDDNITNHDLVTR